jgi:hypothetical protein
MLIHVYPPHLHPLPPKGGEEFLKSELYIDFGVIWIIILYNIHGIISRIIVTTQHCRAATKFPPSPLDFTPSLRADGSRRGNLIFFS